MDSRTSNSGQSRWMWACIGTLFAVLVMSIGTARANAASPVLEFVSPTSGFPIGFTSDGGEVTAALADFDTLVHCTDSQGEGQVVGPRATLSQYVFTGCKAVGGGETGTPCKSEGAGDEEIKTGTIEADLVFIDQAKKEVGMLLNPGGGIYMDFKCGGEPVNAIGPFLAPVSPINVLTTSFTATLARSGATQVPSEYENALGEKRQAIPMGERPGHPPATTGVELGFTIHPDVALEIKAVTAAEIEAKQREEQAALERKRQEEEAATAAAIKRREEEVKRREEEETKAAQLRRSRLISQGIARCRKIKAKPKRVRCIKRVKNKYAVAHTS